MYDNIDLWWTHALHRTNKYYHIYDVMSSECWTHELINRDPCRISMIV